MIKDNLSPVYVLGVDSKDFFGDDLEVAQVISIYIPLVKHSYLPAYSCKGG